MHRKLVLFLVMILSLTLAGTALGEELIITAHRGASSLAPEITLAAVQKGWVRYPLVEVDVHRTGIAYL